MCYRQLYQLRCILLILFLLLFFSVCYHGKCDVVCHCDYDSDCLDFNGEYTDQFDVCRSGCRSGWEGIGCKIGNDNVADGKEANQKIDWNGSRLGFPGDGLNFDGDNSAGNCVDGSSIRPENLDSCGVAAYSHWEVSLGDMLSII